VTLFTKSTALEFGRKGYKIRVNSIHPGLIETDMGQQTFVMRARQQGTNDTERARQASLALHPIGRLGVAERHRQGHRVPGVGRCGVHDGGRPGRRWRLDRSRGVKPCASDFCTNTKLPRPWTAGAEHRLFKDALAQVELADRLGVDYIWEVEHHFLEEYAHSSAPEVFLAACAARTSRIRIGHGVVLAPPGYNHPARVAERIATLDLVSRRPRRLGHRRIGVAVELEGGDALGDAGGMIVAGRRQHHAVTDADGGWCARRRPPGTPRAPRSGRTPRGNGARLPDVVDAQAIGQLDLRQRVLEQTMLGAGCPGPRQLVFVQKSESAWLYSSVSGPSRHRRPGRPRHEPRIVRRQEHDALGDVVATPRRPIGCRASEAWRALSVSLVPCWRARMTKVCWPMSVSMRPGWIE